MFECLLRAAGYRGSVDAFSARQGHYPASFDAYNAVLLTGSRGDSFSDDPWVVDLCERFSALLAQGQRLISVCFGHQLIAHCLVTRVGRAPQGWGFARPVWDLHGPAEFADAQGTLALLASNAHCPIAAYIIDQQVLCVQPNPEFDAAYCRVLLDKRRALFGETVYQDLMDSLVQGHDGAHFGFFLRRLIEQ